MRLTGKIRLTNSLVFLWEWLEIPPNVNYQNEVKLSPIIPITNLHSDPVNNAFVELGSEIQKENTI